MSKDTHRDMSHLSSTHQACFDSSYAPHLPYFIVPECILFTPPTKNTGTSLGSNPTLEKKEKKLLLLSEHTRAYYRSSCDLKLWLIGDW